MSNAMVCPECRSEVEPTWDWCHACGFDPDGLRPSSRITSDTNRALASAPASAGTTPRSATAPEGLLGSTRPNDPRVTPPVPPVAPIPPVAPASPVAPARPAPVVAGADTTPAALSDGRAAGNGHGRSNGNGNGNGAATGQGSTGNGTDRVGDSTSAGTGRPGVVGPPAAAAPPTPPSAKAPGDAIANAWTTAATQPSAARPPLAPPERSAAPAAKTPLAKAPAAPAAATPVAKAPIAPAAATRANPRAATPAAPTSPTAPPSGPAPTTARPAAGPGADPASTPAERNSAAPPTAARPAPAATRPAAAAGSPAPAPQDRATGAPEGRAEAPRPAAPPLAASAVRPPLVVADPTPASPSEPTSAAAEPAGEWADTDGATADEPALAARDRLVIPPAGPPDESHPYFDLPYDNSQEPLVPDTRAGRRSAAKAAAATAPSATRPPPPPPPDASTVPFDALPPLVIAGAPAAPAPPVGRSAEDTPKDRDRSRGRRRGKAAEPAPEAELDHGTLETLTLPPIVPGSPPTYGGSVTYGAASATAKKKGPGAPQIVAITMALAAAALVVYVAFTSYSQSSDASARARSEAAADAKKATPLGAFDIRSATTLAPGQIPATTVPPAPSVHKAVDNSFGVTYPSAPQVVAAKFQAPGSSTSIDGTRTYAAVGDRVFVVDAFEVPGANPASAAATLTAAEGIFGNGVTVLSTAPSTVAGRPATLMEVQTGNGYYGVATVVVSGTKAFVVYEALPLAAKPPSAAAAVAQGEYQSFLSTFAPA